MRTIALLQSVAKQVGGSIPFYDEKLSFGQNQTL